MFFELCTQLPKFFYFRFNKNKHVEQFNSYIRLH